MQAGSGILRTFDFPDRLKQLDNPPKQLLFRGAWPECWSHHAAKGQGDSPLTPVVAIVGARRASALALDFAFRIAKRLAEVGSLIISGGALGVDAAAHRGALAAGGQTAVVLPGSLCRPLPRTNKCLFEDILLSGGVWISEYERPPAGRYAFCARNRLIAALSDFVLVIEAGANSGTAYTVDAALRLGRPLGAVPWQITEERGQVALQVFRRNGYPIGEAQDVYRSLALDFPEQGPKPRGKPSHIGDMVIAAIERHGMMSAQALARELDISIAGMGMHLAELELAGQVQRGNSGLYSLCPGL